MLLTLFLVPAFAQNPGPSADEDYHVYTDSPRLLLNKQRLRLLQRERSRQSMRWTQFNALITGGAPMPEPGFALALYYQVARDEAAGKKAVEWAVGEGQDLRQLAVVFDWCGPLMTKAQSDRLGSKIEKALAGKTTPAGFRSSAIYGTIAASAAAAKLMELNAQQIAAALANAVSFAGGVLQSFADGTDEWRYQVGIVARNGLVAAELARAGSVSAPFAFEGKSGFARAFAKTDLDRGIAVSLGRDWAVLRVAFKPYPVCAFNQTPVTGALSLRQELSAAPAKVRVRMNPYETGYAGMDAVGPFTTISGTLMSIPFCIATTLLHGAPTTRHMTTYDDPAVNELVKRVELVSDPSIPTLSAVIEVETVDGRNHVREQRMTAADYAYDMPTLSAMLRRIGGEEAVPMSAFDRLERFVERLPQGSIEDAISVFTLAPSQARAA